MSVNLKIGTDEPSSRAERDADAETDVCVWHVGKEEGERN